ncbi:GNAT family N-acetyltransferase [Planktotalea sp.]|uniref:GNAT family N-acetyltransferase n=1 Tax=Planktotalea sp. TaxID=2029877 RepID=UPI0032982D78
MNALPSIETLYDVCAQTWPAAVETQVGPWTIRDGQGGGQRTSAATVQGTFGLADLDLAERAMRSLGQDALFMVREGETELDDMLESQGYQIKDPVNVYACPINVLTDVEIPRVTAFSIWEPLQIMRDIWAKGGITEARVNVMERSNCVKTGLFSRWNEKPGGTGYAAIHEGIAMVHALEILAHQRGKGVGKWMMRRAAFWAQDHGATDMSVICTKGNDAANALYTSLGMTLIGGYHYRVKID